MRKPCRIPLETRMDVYEGRADAETNALVSLHLAKNCAACKLDMAWLAAYLPSLRRALEVTEEKVSHAAFERACSIMRPRSRPAVERLIAAAQLLFDSRNRNTAFATARDGEDGSVHLVYRTNAADVDMWQEQTRDGGWYLTGQALSLAGSDLDPPTAATLVGPGNSSQLALIENSEFSFESVTAGQYSLSLLWDNLEIQVDDLRVGSAEAR